MKYLLFLSDCNDIFSENTYIYYVVKIIQWELSFTKQTGRWTEGQTDMTKPVVAFCNFVFANGVSACKGLNCGLCLS